MKLEQLIVQYLYNNKKVTIQDIGTFSISPEVVLPADNDKEMSIPPGAISFEYDNRAPQDDSLVSYIMEQTRKIRSLAASDLESYSILSKQFLNIGKPLVIEGLGTLLKNQQGHYEFTQGQLINPRLEMNVPRITENVDTDISFRSGPRADRRKSKKGLFVALALIFVAIAAASVFYLLKNKKTEHVDVSTQDTIPAATQTTAPVINVPDTTQKTKPDSATTAPVAAPTVANDGYTFKVVIKEYSSKEAAEKAYARLTRYGHKLILAPIDSVRYKLSMPFNTPITDSTRAKDSLRIFFQSKTYIEL